MTLLKIKDAPHFFKNASPNLLNRQTLYLKITKTIENLFVHFHKMCDVILFAYVKGSSAFF